MHSGSNSHVYIVYDSIWTTVFKLFYSIVYNRYTYHIWYHKQWHIQHHIITLYAILYTIFLIQYQASTWCIFRFMMRMSEKLHKKHKLTQKDAFWKQQSCLNCIWYSIWTFVLLYCIIYDIYTYRIRYHERWRIQYRKITLYAVYYTTFLIQYQASTWCIFRPRKSYISFTISCEMWHCWSSYDIIYIPTTLYVFTTTSYLNLRCSMSTYDITSPTISYVFVDLRFRILYAFPWLLPSWAQNVN
jgi:hypothetical protein